MKLFVVALLTFLFGRPYVPPPVVPVPSPTPTAAIRLTVSPTPRQLPSPVLNTSSDKISEQVPTLKPDATPTPTATTTLYPEPIDPTITIIPSPPINPCPPNLPDQDNIDRSQIEEIIFCVH